MSSLDSREAKPDTNGNAMQGKRDFDLEGFLNSNKVPLLVALIGLILLGLGVFFYRNTTLFEEDKIEIIGDEKDLEEGPSEVVVEIAGSIEKPGVYKLSADSSLKNSLLI